MILHNHCDIGDEDSLPEIKYELILRKWVDVNPAMEFRCFVKNNNLIGISQRDVSNLYLLVGREEEILDDIQHFFRNQIRSRFSDDKYVFDVYRQSKRDVVLIDFNPFGRTTDALLFDWDSLLSSTLDDDNEIPEFRCIRESVGVQPNPYRNSVPKDFVDLGSGMDALKLIDLMNLSTNSNGHLNGDSSP
uniref:Uncharacterized protein n=1 Tax=Strigamia maritima TaxID=126957 RepID=T1JNB7_STRMM